MNYLNKALLYCLPLALLSCDPESRQDAAGESAQVEEPAAQPTVCIRQTWVKETPEAKGKNITTLFQGEKVTALARDTTSETTEDRKKARYQKIQLADGTEGWVRDFTIAIGAQPAVAVREAAVYARPHMMVPTGKSFQAMDVVGVIEPAQDGWTVVTGRPQGETRMVSGWVKAENLSSLPSDIAVSAFYARAMSMDDKAKQREEIQKILQNPDLSSSVFYSAVSKMK